MKFIINRKDLSNILQRVQTIVSGQAGKEIKNPILNHIKMEVAENRITITASGAGGEGLSLITHMDDCVQVLQPGSICVKFARLFNIVKVLGHETCTISVEDVMTGPMIIHNGRTDVTIDECRYAEEFPPIGQFAKDLQITMKTEELRRMIAESEFSIGKRPNFNGMHIAFNEEEKTLRFVSTDANRMSWSEASVETIQIANDPELTKMLLSPKAVAEIKRCCSEGEDCTLSFGENGFMFETNQVFLLGYMLGGNFPPYQKTLNNLYRSVVNVATLDRVKTNAICDRVRTISINKDNASLNMEFSDQEVTFSLSQNGKKIFEDHLEIDFEGNPVEIAFKCQYVQDILKALDSELVKFHLGRTRDEACIVRVPERGGCEYVIMPMRIG